MLKAIDLQDYAARAQEGLLSEEEEKQLVSTVYRLTDHNRELRMKAASAQARIEAIERECEEHRAMMNVLNGFAPVPVNHKHFVSGMEASHPEQELQ